MHNKPHTKTANNTHAHQTNKQATQTHTHTTHNNTKTKQTKNNSKNNNAQYMYIFTQNTMCINQTKMQTINKTNIHT